MKTICKNSLIAINICFITLIGLIKTNDRSDSLVFSIVPALICIIILLFGDKNFKLFENRNTIIWDIALTGLFILMLSLEDVLKTMQAMDSEPFNTVVKTMFFPVLIVSMMIDTDYALWMGGRNHEGSDEEKSYREDGKFLGIYYPVWLLISVTFVFVIAYYPGLMNSDFEKQWIWGGGVETLLNGAIGTL